MFVTIQFIDEEAKIPIIKFDEIIPNWVFAVRFKSEIYFAPTIIFVANKMESGKLMKGLLKLKPKTKSQCFIS